MDYSVYDAVQAGFDKVVFVIRRSLEDEFKEVIGKRIEKKYKKNSFSNFALRSYISTFIAQFSDNFIFATIVSKTFFALCSKNFIFLTLI